MRDAARSDIPGRLTPVADALSLDELFARSHAEAVVLFNHDPYCGSSGAAHAEMERLGADIAVVDVARHHDLGQLVAAKTGVRHHSPQVIVLRGGRAVWSATHFRVTAAAVRGALETVGQRPANGTPRAQDAPAQSAARPWWKVW